MASLFPDSKSATPGKPPVAGADWVLAHCDGGSRGNPGPAGFGALLVDSHGQTVAELSDFLGVRTNNYAEYSGLLACLDYALKNGHSRLKVISDSELMVKQIQGKYKVNSPDLKPLWQQARDRIARLDGFQISHALRHKNKEADALANQAMDRGTRSGTSAKAGEPVAVRSLPLRPKPQTSKPSEPPRAGHPTATMHRGFTRDGVVYLLGGANLPDGIFVKIIRE